MAAKKTKQKFARAPGVDAAAETNTIRERLASTDAFDLTVIDVEKASSWCL